MVKAITLAKWMDWWQIRPGLSFVLVTLCAPRGMAGVFDRFTGLMPPHRRGAQLGPDDGSLQEQEADK